MHALTQNLQFTFRRLRRTPAFTLTVVLTLALGIGATTAIFSLVEGVLLRPLPFQDADRLVLLGDHLGGRPGMSVRAREIETYTLATGAFSSLGGYITTSFELSGGAQPEQINAARLNSGMFPTLGVQPILGRVFTPQEDDARQPVAVISYALWTDRKSTRLNSSHMSISYAVFCLKKKKKIYSIDYYSKKKKKKKNKKKN